MELWARSGHWPSHSKTRDCVKFSMVQNSLLLSMSLGHNPSKTNRTSKPQTQACKFIKLFATLGLIYKTDSLPPLRNCSVDWKKLPETLTWGLRCLVSCLQKGRTWHSDARAQTGRKTHWDRSRSCLLEKKETCSKHSVLL